MPPQTNLQQIKETAYSFLMLEPQLIEDYPIVKHPFTDSNYVSVKSGDEYQLLNITECKEAMRKWRKCISEYIDNAETLSDIYTVITKSYRMAFLKHTMPYMSQKDFSEYLSEAWVSCEAPNGDPNFTTKQLVGLFKKADPLTLMTKDEYAVIQKLNDFVTVYRGVTEYNADRVKALSWSLEKQTADWFAHRFGENGTVYEAQVSKEHILAFFNARNEKEVIVDPQYLMDIKQIQVTAYEPVITM